MSMDIMRHTTLSLSLLLAFTVHAQSGLSDLLGDPFYIGPATFENAEDSAAFARFLQSLTVEHTGTERDGATYRMMWRETQQGGLWTVSRGDGSRFKPTRGASTIQDFVVHTPFRTTDGRRGVLVSSERPCALVCRSAIYYLEE